ncbi:hypothetical protein, partial [Burkholderia glumae]
GHLDGVSERREGKSIPKLTHCASFKIKMALTGHFSPLSLLIASSLPIASCLDIDAGRARAARNGWRASSLERDKSRA